MSSQRSVMDSPKVLIWMAVGLSSVAIVGCLFIFPLYYLDINELHQEVAIEMEQFKILTDDIWKDMMELTKKGVLQRNPRQVPRYSFGRLMFGDARNPPLNTGNEYDYRFQPNDALVFRQPPNYGPQPQIQRPTDGYNSPPPVFSTSAPVTGGSTCKCDASAASRCPAGPPGPDGNAGENGEDGIPGMSGAPGMDGDAIEIKMETMCPSCPGGDPGPPGPPGPMGNPGQKGPPGESNQQVVEGPAGPPGPKGPNGPPGQPGNPGRTGERGRPGSGGKGPPGPKGRPGPPGPAGPPGQRGMDAAGNGRPGTPGDKGRPGPGGNAGNPGTQGPPGGPGMPGNDAQYCPCPPRRQGQQYGWFDGAKK